MMFDAGNAAVDRLAEGRGAPSSLPQAPPHAAAAASAVPLKVRKGKTVPRGFVDAAGRYFAGDITFRDIGRELGLPLDELKDAFIALD
jgi:hypothetical protein